MVREADFTAVIARCKKIMGPVAESLAKEAAQEAGAKVSGESVSISSDAQYASVLSKYREKLSKIIGKPLAENLVK